MDSKKPFYKSKTLWVLGLFLLYSTLGFFAVPYFIKKELSKVVINDLNSQLTVDDISFNPYTISADITGIKITDTDSTTWFTADKIHTNVNLWTSLFKHISLSKVQIDNPYYLLSTEELTQSQSSGQTTVLKYPQISGKNKTTDEAALLLDIDAIEINKGSIDYNNKTSSKHLNLNIKEIAFNHQSFSTLDFDSQFSLSFITENNDKTDITGSFNFVKSSLKASWKLSNWSTSTIFNLLGDNNNSIQGFQNESGLIITNGSTVYSGISDTSPKIIIDYLELSNFANKVENPEQVKISIPKLQINNIDVNLDEQMIDIESIDAANTELLLSLDESFELIFQQFNEPTNKPPENDNGEKPWDYAIHSITANQAQLHLNKLQGNDSQINEITFNTLDIKNFSSKQGQTAEINLSIVVDSDGQIDVKNQLTITPLKLISQFNIKDINIEKWQKWIPVDINIGIAEGLLSLQQELTFENNEFMSQGWVKLNKLRLLDDNNQQFAAINQLDLEQTTIDSETHKISLNNITLDQAHGSLIISEDEQLNINGITSKSTDAQTDDSASDDWIIEIKQINLIDAKTNVIDKSIQPNYQTELSKLNGSIKGLSSDNLSKADVDLKGVFDTYGKIEVTGQINPLSEKAYTDLSITIEDLDLQNFSSYSGQFLGFPITRGKADFELKYKLNQSILEGINNLKFKQLKFGKRTASKDAVSLPLKLAVGLLTDGKGIMKIKLPVRGNIDDPEFSYGGIVFKAFFKLITGIVTSPFKLLGKLIPGGADLDLSGIQFVAGTALLSTGEEAKLKAMKKIIQQRPAIILELTGVVNTINDKKALQQIQLLSLLKLDSKPSFDDSFPIKASKKLYISTFSQEKWSELESTSSKENVLNTALLSENAWNELLTNQDVNQQLNSLGKKRTAYVQQQLIETHELPQDKIFIKSGMFSEELYPQVKFGVGQ